MEKIGNQKYITCKGDCGDILPHDPKFFHKNGKSLRTTCKKCRNKKSKESSKEYYQDNINKKRKYNSEYYLENAEELKKKAQDYYDGVIDG
jgi:hypothetical protein